MTVSLSTARLDSIEEPTEADLLAEETEVADLDVTDWEALLEPVIVTPKFDEDYWDEDENVHDDRYDGEGVPSWSAWA